MNPNDVAPMIIFSILSVAIATTVILRGPVGKALARRLEGSAALGEGVEARVEELEQRLAAMEHERTELAERVDFAERMLLEAKDRVKEIGR